jgi:hypothetical protein
MPKGPKGQKRPADLIDNAIRVAKIATGEEVEDFGGSTQPAWVALLHKGAPARARLASNAAATPFLLCHQWAHQ